MRNTILFSLLVAMPFCSEGQNVGIGNTNPQALFSVGNQSQFTVDSSGNLTHINNVNVNFPAQQGRANTFLRNDGAGNLAWSRNLPLYSTILSPILSDSFAAYGYTLDGKINFPSYAQRSTPKTGEWALTPTPSNPFPYNGSRSNIIYSPTYEEFSFYSNRYMYFYNIANNNWFQSTRLNIPGYDSLAYDTKIVASGTNIYLVYGSSSSNPSYNANQFVKYNVVADSWTLLPGLPDSVRGPVVCANDSKVYVLGGGKLFRNGLSLQLNQTNKLFVFDINAGSWTTAASNLNSSYTAIDATGVLAGNKIYSAGGNYGEGSTSASSFYTSLDLTTYNFSVIAFSSFPLENYDVNKDSLNNIWVSYKAGDDNIFFRNPAGTNSVIYEVPYVNGPRGTAFWKNGTMIYFNPQPDFLYRYNPDAGPVKEIFFPSYKKEFYLYYKN